MNRLRENIENPLFWVVALFIISSIFRIFFLSNIEFKFDEALSFFNIFELVKYHKFPLIGIQSSTGIYNFPFVTYFLSLLSLPYLNPQFLTFCIAFLNVLATPFFYLFVRKFYSNAVAVSASLLLALSPWSILFSRKIWPQDVLMIFLLPFLYFLHRLILLKDKKSSFWLFLSGVLLLQIHGSGMFFVLITLIFLLLRKTATNYKYGFFGGVIGAIPALPYLYYQFFSGSFCRDCSTFLFVQSQIHGFDLLHFLRPFQLFTAFPFSFELGKDYLQFLKLPFILPIQFFLLLNSMLFLIGCLYVYEKMKKNMFLIIYIVLLPLFYSLTRITSHIHYYIVLFPIVAIVTSLGLRFVFVSLKSNFLKLILLILFSLIILSYIIFEIQFYSFISAKKIIRGDYGVTFETTETLLNSELQSYSLLGLSYYDELKYYGYIFIHSSMFHARMGDFFVDKDNLQLALGEYKKDFKVNPKGSYAKEKIKYLERVIKQNLKYTD